MYFRPMGGARASPPPVMILFVAKIHRKVFLIYFDACWQYFKHLKDNFEFIFKHHIKEGRATIQLKRLLLAFASVMIKYRNREDFHLL